LLSLIHGRLHHHSLNVNSSLNANRMSVSSAHRPHSTLQSCNVRSSLLDSLFSAGFKFALCLVCRFRMVQTTVLTEDIGARMCHIHACVYICVCIYLCMYVCICVYIYIYRYGPGSSVGIATDYGLEGPGSNPGRDEIFRPSRPALGPTQPPSKWVPGLSRG